MKKITFGPVPFEAALEFPWEARELTATAELKRLK